MSESRERSGDDQEDRRSPSPLMRELLSVGPTGTLSCGPEPGCDRCDAVWPSPDGLLVRAQLYCSNGGNHLKGR